jgi:hypothetical protein
VTLRARWVTLRACWVTPTYCWVTLRASWATLTPRCVLYLLHHHKLSGVLWLYSGVASLCLFLGLANLVLLPLLQVRARPPFSPRCENCESND